MYATILTEIKEIVNLFWKRITALEDELKYQKARVELLEGQVIDLRKLLLDCAVVSLDTKDRVDVLANDFLYHYHFLYHLEPDAKGKLRPIKPKISVEDEYRIIAQRHALIKGTNYLSASTKPLDPAEE